MTLTRTLLQFTLILFAFSLAAMGAGSALASVGIAVLGGMCLSIWGLRAL